MNVDRGYEIIQEVWSISFSSPSVTVYAPRVKLFPSAVGSQASGRRGLDVEGF